ncbi:hypothetical protein CTA2_8861 [Colletotrichum tanaceti]|uniref:Uncharacterized protein n=1 Tax=Colletotrichum tanaceti TaxID=1306861 RepID=A0A4U6XST5_9PEZI|nr:hypothetical protein CTA2_8861 [Colletotrichum tanaceti]TKW59003.1 hypothetical protein CTA1_11602 [Colletotrichum tanaceti]
MARRSGNTAEPTGANGTRDIRSLFGAARTAKNPEPSVLSSLVSQESGLIALPSLSPAAAPELPTSTRYQTRSAKPPKQSMTRTTRSKKGQAEMPSPGAERRSGRVGSPTTSPRPAPSSSNLNTSASSLSDLQTTPVLPPSLRRLIYQTPGRRRTRSRSRNSGNDATPDRHSMDQNTGSSRKVRFSSLPLSVKQSPEPEEVTTPRRRLFDQTRARKTASESPPGSPLAGLLPGLPSLRKSQPSGTLKRDSSGEPKTNGTPNRLPSLPSLPSSPSISPSPSTARKRPTLARDAVIKGSDDDDNDGSFSDDSFPDLDMLGPTKPRLDGTPKAKRRARMVHKSPLTIQPKHKFDFKTLDAHSRRHDVLFDSPKRPAASGVRPQVVGDLEASPSKARQKLIEIAGVKNEEDADKAMKAMERTDAGAPRTNWYFFKKDVNIPGKRATLPKKYAKGPWSFLEKAETRDQHIMSGMPASLATTIAPPDELYLWILDMVNVEEVGVIQEEYLRIAAANRKQVKRLVTPQRIEEVLRKLGAADHIGDEMLKPVREIRDVYVNRDWKHLQSFLVWLYWVAAQLSHESVVLAVKMLLRMAADRAILENADILTYHRHAMEGLVNSVEEGLWDDFCAEICSSLYHGFDKTSLRMLPLVCLPVTSPKLHELRRRLAVAFFLRDAALASEHPDDAISLHLVIARVKDSDFQINNRTDYTDLKALVQLLDIAVDDGSFVHSKGGREHEAKFNAEIDDLARRLKAIWRGINDTGAANLSRTEAKSVLEWVGERLNYSVRTRRPPTQSIFGDQEPSSAKKRRQQEFMHQFVHSRKNRPAGTTVIEAESLPSEDDTCITALG